MKTKAQLNKFIGIIKRFDLSKEEIIRTLETISSGINEVEIDSWKGKSSFEINRNGEEIIVIKYQKPERGAKAKPIKTIIQMRELSRLLRTIEYLFSRNKYESIKSRIIGEEFYNVKWDDIFSKRPIHNKFTIMLNVLEKKGLIDYRGGLVYLR